MTAISEAADRLRSWMRDGKTFVFGNVFEHDATVLAAAYLAEHPADENESATMGWLRSVGFANIDEHNSGVAICDPEDTVMLSMGYRGQWLLNGFELPEKAWPTTRGDVRRLCNALGIELKAA